MAIIRVTNLTNGEILPHCLALIEGEILQSDPDQLGLNCPCPSESISVYLTCANGPSGTMVNWPVVNGRFKALVQLSRGANDVQLRTSSATFTSIRLSYDPPDVGGRCVRLLYVVCADDANVGRFQGPPDQPADRFCVESARRRIGLGARLVQTFTAENMVRLHRLPRRTFQLEDVNGCGVLMLESTSAERARTMCERDLWCLVRDTLASKNLHVDVHDPRLLLKYVAFLSFTRYVPASSISTSISTTEHMSHGDIVRLTEGHAALGGGGLALLGSGCLHTWAEDLSEVVARFKDATPIDRQCLMDDSGYRGTHWACFANTLGALCHELGHTFGLGHAADDRGVMGRGFGDIHRMFVADDAQSDADEHEDVVVTSYGRRLRGNWGRAFWDFTSAAWLSYHKWFNAAQLGDSGQAPKLHDLSEVRARHGLRVVVLMDGDRVIEQWQFTRGFGTPTLRLPATLLAERATDMDAAGHHFRRAITVKAIDTFGNILGPCDIFTAKSNPDSI